MFIFAGLVIGIPMVLIWFFLRRKAQASLSWPTVPGRIVDSRLAEFRDSDGDVSTVASIKYAYAVQGTPFEGSRVKLSNSTAPASVKKYPTGTDVPVYYDPAKLASALLEPGGSGLKALLVVGLLVMLGGTLMQAFPAATKGGQGSTQAYDSAVGLYNQGKFAEARPAFETAAHTGSAEAKVYLGVMYAKAQGIPQDFVEAEKWFIQAGEPAKKNRLALQKGLTPAQEQES